MRAKDIMTRCVASVASDTSLVTAAALMVDQRVSALVVIDDGKLVGIVSQTDLLRRQQPGPKRDRAACWSGRRAFDNVGASWLQGREGQALAMQVFDVMTSRVVTVAEDARVADISALFEKHKIRQTPVIDAGWVVGIVGYADFVRALVTRDVLYRHAQASTDSSIRRRAPLCDAAGGAL